jgi:hypothetical protein
MFAAWGEVLAYKLENIIDENQYKKDDILNVKDYFNESKQSFFLIFIKFLILTNY